MVKKVALISVTVVRHDKPVTVAPGTAFDFTKEELADLDKLEEMQRVGAETSRPAYRDLIVEKADESEEAAAAAAKTGKTGKKDDKEL